MIENDELQESEIMDRKITVYDPFRAQMEELSNQNRSMVFDYNDPAGNKAIRSHVYKLRQTKSAVDQARKKEKAASLEYGRRVDSEAKEIIAQIDEMIDVHAKPLEEIEQRERDRVQQHKDYIEGMLQVTRQQEHPDGRPLTSSDYQTALVYLLYLDNHNWEEFREQAEAVRLECIDKVKIKVAERQKYEEEQVELARLRKEAEERARKDRDEAIRLEAEQRVLKQAEEEAKRERARAEESARKEREAAVRREAKLVLVAERAKRAKEEAIQKIKEAKRLEAEAIAKREADLVHCAAVNNVAISALMNGGLSSRDSKVVVALIADGKIPAVSITY